jgi:hypothetical protein
MTLATRHQCMHERTAPGSSRSFNNTDHDPCMELLCSSGKGHEISLFFFPKLVLDW